MKAEKKSTKGMVRTASTHIGRPGFQKSSKSTGVPRKKGKSGPERLSSCTAKATTNGTAFKQRLGYRYLESKSDCVPHCSHGPCILIGKRSADGKITDRNFVCAVYRSGECSFRCPADTEGIPDLSSVSGSKFSSPEYTKKKSGIRKVWKSVGRLLKAGDALYYCKTCNDAVSSSHEHLTLGPLRRIDFRKPSYLMSADDSDSSKAQYWFSDECLKVLANVVNANDYDGILCIGAPTVFEFFRRTAQRRNTYKSFLLDLDERFSAFYRRTEFAEYSMLVDYFYDSFGAKKLGQFFAQVKRVIVICDPPFGILTDPLMESFGKLRSRFLDVQQSDNTVYDVVLALPYFLEKYVKYDGRLLSMVDYSVCYKNHKKYGKPGGSIVRFFTNIPLNNFILPLESGYRFCEMCERFVSPENRHCFMCGICPSKNGLTYRHCARCSRCVKPSYRHCKNCSRCHLPGRCIQLHAVEDDGS